MNLLSASELAILDFIQNHLRCSFLDWLLPKITLLGNSGIFWILLAITFLFFRRYRKLGAEMGIALILCFVFGNLILKPLIARIRPYDLNPGIVLLLNKPPVDFSFPSGHTYASFASALLLLFHKKSWGIAALILSTLIAFSRLYLYVHYPTDVLAGLLLGLFFGLLSHKLIQHFTNSTNSRIHRELK